MAMNVKENEEKRLIFLGQSILECIEDSDIRNVEILLEKGADVNVIIPNRGHSPLHYVAGVENETFGLVAARLFLKHGGDPNVQNDDELTPVHVAAAQGHSVMLRLLLSSGGNPSLRDAQQLNAYDYAWRDEHWDTLDVIKDFEIYGIGGPAVARRPRVSCVFEKVVVNLPEVRVEYGVESSPAATTNSSTCLSSEEPSGINHVGKSKSQVESGFLASSVVESNSTITINTTNTTATATTWTSSSSCIGGDITTATCKSSPEVKRPCREPVPSIRVTRPSFCPDKLNILPVASDESLLFVNDSRVVQLQNIEEWLANRISPGEESLELEDYYTCEEEEAAMAAGNDPLNTAAIGDALQMGDRQSLSSLDTVATMSECYRHTDEEYGISLLEERFFVWPIGVSDEGTDSCPCVGTESETCDTEAVRKELRAKGYLMGPVTSTTKKVYKRYLRRANDSKSDSLSSTSAKNDQSCYCAELRRSLKEKDQLFFVKTGEQLEKEVAAQFSKVNHYWREGTSKTSFTYLLLDPRITENLPCRAVHLKPIERWSVFLRAIFYIGKGKRGRPFAHLYEAVERWRAAEKSDRRRREPSRKVQRIVDIWADGLGVVCLHVFQNVIPVEAYTREAAMIDALGLVTLCNAKRGEYYGKAASWFGRNQRLLGIHLLHKALQIFLLEGERQLRPSDVGR